jgi:methionyl-tRNA formyltransferase
MKLLVMADGKVGDAIVRWLLHDYGQDVAAVITTASNDTLTFAMCASTNCAVFESAEQVIELAGDCDLGLLAWWPSIIKQPLLGHPRHGWINTHPSLLPHGRGKNPNFWAIVEQEPFGVSLHMAEEGIDSGAIVAQRTIPYGWEATGGDLYNESLSQMFSLFTEAYPEIRKLDFTRTSHLFLQGWHRSGEMETLSKIFLERLTTARQLLNLLRARTFPGHPACYFEDNGKEYEVRVEITRRR